MRLAALVVMCMSAICSAGTFTVTDKDASGTWVHYEGYVESWDYLWLQTFMENTTGRVFIVIDSPGGSAAGGINLYYEAEKWDRLVTIAGKYGAWSAAALFWLGSPKDIVGPDGIVGFHQAYCDPVNPPGCDLSSITIVMNDILFREGFDSGKFIKSLNWLQLNIGVRGWIIKNEEGWFIKLPNAPLIKTEIHQGLRPFTPDRVKRILDEISDLWDYGLHYVGRFGAGLKLPGATDSSCV